MSKDIKKMIRSLLYREKSSSDKYVDYLRRKGANIGSGVFFFSPEKTNIDSVRIDWITIGDFTKISSGFLMLAHDYSSSVLISKYNKCLLPGGMETVIGSNCFIGMNVSVMPGVKIGDNVILGTGSIVTNDIPSNSIAAGVPARVISTLDNYYEKRINNYLIDAKRNINHFIKKNGKKPSIKDCGAFSELFLERTEENYHSYIQGYLAAGNDEIAVRKVFFESKPKFSSIEDFLAFVENDNEIDISEES